MELILDILLGSLGTWLTLLIVVPIAGRLAGFSFPGWSEALGKLAIIAVATNGLTVIVALLLGGLLGWIAGLIIFWVLMVKWFDVDLFGAIVIVVVSWLVRIFIVGALIGLIATAV